MKIGSDFENRPSQRSGWGIPVHGKQIRALGQKCLNIKGKQPIIVGSLSSLKTRATKKVDYSPHKKNTKPLGIIG